MTPGSAPYLTPEALRALLGQIDVYLLDQVLKGRIRPPMRLLDAGCGHGRNLVYLLRAGLDVCAIDRDPAAVAAVRALAADLAPSLPPANFRAEAIEASSLEDGAFDVVLANAVLHFARDHAHFRAMLDGLWRMLAAGGLLFARLTSDIGIEGRGKQLGDGRYHLPDGSDRYLVTRTQLASLETELGAERIEPLKTVNVDDQRAMTTWVVAKPRRGSAQRG